MTTLELDEDCACDVCDLTAATGTTGSLGRKALVPQIFQALRADANQNKQAQQV